jgi:hypothetical protein
MLFAVNGALATPLEFVATVIVLVLLLKVPPAPEAGPVKVTLTPETGLLDASSTVTASAFANTVPTVADCGVVPVLTVIVLGALTARVADAVLPVPPLFEVTAPVVLTFAPGDVAVTLTETVHVPEAAMVPPEKVKVVSPAFGAKVPPQLVLAPGVEATAKPAGSVSGKPTPVS